MSKWEKKANKILNEYFNIDELKPKQYEIIDSLLNGNDVIGLLPTGYGKSLCYILPSLLTKKTTFIISPLIALMDDQKEKLTKNKIICATLHSNNANKNQELNSVKDGDIDIVFMSPEFLIEGEGLDIAEILIKEDKMGFLAIDEAHCICSWGFDFRKEYTKIIQFRQKFPQIPILALTATARSAMCEEIKNSLGLTDTVVIKTSFDRNNIFFGIEEIATSKQEKSYKNRGKTLKRIVDAKIPKHIIIKSWIDSYPNEKIIVYINSRSECDELSIKLNEICPNVSKSYNAGLSKEKRETIQKEFSTGIFNVIICTIAFGMGIDQIVRGVLIFGYPSSIEEYYQQIGRAGRDNKPSFSIFYYDYCQMMKNKAGLKDEKKIEQIDALTKLIYSPFCKRKYILEYFEEKCDFTNCNNCSNCCNFINCENNLIDVTSIFSDIILKNSIKTATIKIKPYLTRDGNKILFFSHFKEWKELYSKLVKPTKKDKAKLKLIYNNKYISIPIEEPVDLDDLDNLEKKYRHLLN